jgi:hypothetical protein
MQVECWAGVIKEQAQPVGDQKTLSGMTKRERGACQPLIVQPTHIGKLVHLLPERKVWPSSKLSVSWPTSRILAPLACLDFNFTRLFPWFVQAMSPSLPN